MTIAVTGANGFLGSALIERLVARGHAPIRALVRAGSDLSRLQALRERVGDAFEVRSHSLTTRDAAAKAIDGATVVHHVAASFRGAPADMVMGTVVATRNLLEAITAREEPPKLVLVSSFSVYGVASLPRGHVVDEMTPIEPLPRKRDPYAQVKIRQEALCWQHRLDSPYPLVVVRPGVLHGPSGNALSSRIGLQLPGIYLHLGADNVLPLSYVDNCAEALVIAGERGDAIGEIYNAHDDDLPTARAYLARYRSEVRPLRAMSLPYPVTMLGSWLSSWYSEHSHGQLPAILSPYKTATLWKGTRFDNRKIKSLGWQQIVATDEALGRTFADLRRRAA